MRSKRRWVLSTLEITEEDKGPYPKKISQVKTLFTNEIYNHSGSKISRLGLTRKQ